MAIYLLFGEKIYWLWMGSNLLLVVIVIFILAHWLRSPK